MMRQLAYLLTCAVLAAAGSPPEPLAVDPGGRLLTAGSGRPVFLLADTAWSLCARLRREEVDMYLLHRRSQGFNAVAFVLINPAQGPNAYGVLPMAVRGGRMDPAAPIEGPGGYWDQVDYIIGRTRALGLYAIVLPAWGSAVAGAWGGQLTREIIFNPRNAYLYGNWLGRRYGAQKHIIWMLGGDRSAVYGRHDYRPVFRGLAEGIGDGAHGESRQDGNAAYGGLLMSYHPRKESPQSSEWFHEDRWLSFHSIQHWPEDQIAAIAHDRDLTPPKPTWIFEGRYEGYWKKPYQAEQWGEWPTRFQAWQTVFAGAFGHTYGHERVFGFGQDGANWKQALDAPGARSMTHLARFMNSLAAPHAFGRVRDQALIDGEEGKAGRLNSDRITAARDGDGGLAMFYSANGRAIRVRMDRLPKARMNAWWFNPRNGMWHVAGEESERQRAFAADIAAGPGTPVREFDPPGRPGDGNDWVLALSSSAGL